MKSNSWTKAIGDRRTFIGGSDARIIMGDDEDALIRLWREKRGEVEPEDLSDNLIVQLGSVTEDLNRHWFERNTKFAQPRSLGRKVSDEFTVPLCRDHHHELHRHGNEMAWWANLQIAPIEVARELWAATLLQADPASDRRSTGEIVPRLTPDS